MTAGRPEVLCHTGVSWIGRWALRLAVRVLLSLAYSWPVPTAAAQLRCERCLDALVARPVWWRTRARALVAELLSQQAG